MCSKGGKPTRQFQWYAPDSRTEVVTYDCPCEDQWELHRFLLNSGIGLAYQRLAWVDGVAIEPGGIEVVEGYLSMAEDATNSGLGLLLWGGGRGTGKTMLSALLLKRLLAEGHDGYFTTFSNLLDKLMESWNSPEARTWFHARIRNAKVLVVDDVGREMKQRRMVKGEGMKDYQTATSEFAIESVLRHRLANAMPTIITTNLSVKELTSHYGEHFKSLLTEAAQAYEFKGADFRTQSSRRLHEEALRGLRRPVVIG